MCSIGVTEGKIEREGKMSLSIFIFIYTIHLAYTKFETLDPIGAKKSVTDIFIGEKEKLTNKETDKQYMAAFYQALYQNSES